MTGAALGLSLAMWQDDVLSQEHKRRHKKASPNDEQVKILFENWEKEAFSMGKSRLIGMKEVCAAFEAGYHSKNENRWHFPSKGEYPENSEDILIFYRNRNEDKGTQIGYFKDGNWSIDYIGLIDKEENEEVIAWQYLPEPPENSTEGANK